MLLLQVQLSINFVPKKLYSQWVEIISNDVNNTTVEHIPLTLKIKQPQMLRSHNYGHKPSGSLHGLFPGEAPDQSDSWSLSELCESDPSERVDCG